MLNNLDELLVQDSEHSFHFKLDTHRAPVGKSPNMHAVNGSNLFIVATDCDDVLVNITDKWVAKAQAHPVISTYFKDKHLAEIMISESALTRNCYSLVEWLEIEDKEHQQIMYDLYFQDPTFYDDLEPTAFAKSLSPAFLEKVAELHVVTACGYDAKCPANMSKLRWLTRFLKAISHNTDLVFKVHMLPYGVSKGKFMHDNGIKFNTFVDDAPYNVIEVANSTPYSNYEIMIPCYGFNQNIGEMRAKITSDHNFKIVGFHNIESVNPDDLIANLKSYHEGMLAKAV